MTKRLMAYLVVMLMALNLVACGGQKSVASGGDRPTASVSRSKPQLSAKISEAAPPEPIQQLRQYLEPYQPQVKILSPKANQVLQDNEVNVQFDVKDLPLFKDPTLGLGPHLHVILDNEPYRAVYDASQPLVLKDLTPGTHTLRVFASRPWHESFKNEGAYAQTTFHIFTTTDENNPASELPLLSYSRPNGTYGAEPIMLDFYLTNAPLHLVAQEDAEDEIADWRIRCTINGESFVLDHWQPIYLKGFKPGKNWVQIEFLDEKGNPVKNQYNNTVRLITYEPGGTDTLSKLVRQELSVAEARGIVDPNYQPPTPAPAPEPVPTPESSPIPAPESTPVPEPKPTPALESSEKTEAAPEATPSAPAKPGFFNRFGRSKAVPTPAPTPIPVSVPDLTEPAQAPEPEPVEEPAAVEPAKAEEPVVPPELAPAPSAPAKPSFFNRFGRSKPAPIPSPVPIPAAEPAPVEEPVVEPPTDQPTNTLVPTELPDQTPEPVPAASPDGSKTAKPAFFNRFSRPKSTPAPAPTATPEVAPAAESEQTPAPQEPVESAEPSPVPEVTSPEVPTVPKASLLERFGRSKSAPVPPVPAVPEATPTEPEVIAPAPDPIPSPVEAPAPRPEILIPATPKVSPTPKTDLKTRFLQRTAAQPERQIQSVPDILEGPESNASEPDPEPVTAE